ncbi:phospholipase D family protein [Demequina sp. SYSU T00068]|uniref:phospholipase D family protein n=1 Tax=Demequina lignilytica TaxID=3051663 RepID=UPI00262946E5|nr:phospholipase D family protein [Demequina sp. SYSU T00068]MDN4491046.1 phospholipase D family protein [Demequina sp. SYSU T00068]
MLKFQRPGGASGYLLEHLLLESMGAVGGGGIFAWANLGGIKSLIEDEIFDEFLMRGNFRLFVGTDSITDPAAVERLVAIETRRPRFDARAFMSPDSSLFHPKLAWFEHESHLSLVVGSGNLTMGGLRSNWEAFTVLRLTGGERAEATSHIEDFLTDVTDFLLPVSDPRVLERVKLNTGNERSLRRHSSPTSPALEVAPFVEDVLVAEIPRAGDRWAQANFDQENYEGFFGAEVGSQRRISLYHVDENAHVSEVESRPSVEVASKNYRFELAAARGRAYPVSGPPIGVFCRLRSGAFLYALLLPGDAGYAEMDGLLASRWQGRSDRKRRVRVQGAEVRKAWPDSPVWRAEVPAL